MIGAKRGQRPGLSRSRSVRSSADDIPEARRVIPHRPTRSTGLQKLTVGAALLVLLAAAVAVIFPGPLRRWVAPAPVPGLAARLSSDGRLLGHFPYAETSPRMLVAVAPGHELHRDAATALLAMQRAAAADGVELVVLSAFRSIDLQQQLFFDVKSERAQSARERARVSAPPGFSEHSTGYAVDLGDATAPTTNLAEAFEDTTAFRWLERHAPRFHFVLSFPRGNAQGVSYEPWHWRFEGTSEALKVFEPSQRLAR